MTKMETEKTSIVKGQCYEGADWDWIVPEDVAAALNLCGYTLYGPKARVDKGGNDGFSYFLDVWVRSEFDGNADESKGRVYNSEWAHTAEESLNNMIRWVRAGMPDGFGEATGGEK